MSQEDDGALQNASVIIERFGGIRPMAAKVGAPVTTVQGWKKRDVIPGSRREDVLNAANENRIDLSDLLKDEANVKPFPGIDKPGAGAEGGFGDTSSPSGNDNVKISVEPFRSQPKSFPSSLSPRIDTTHEELMDAIAKGQKKAVRASIWTGVILAGLVAGGAYLAFQPSAKKIEQHGTQIAALEDKVGIMGKDVQSLNDSAGFIKDMVPEKMREQMSALKSQADALQNDIKTVATQAQDLSKTVLATDAGSMSDRLSVLEAKFADMQGGEALKDLTARIRGLEVTLAGQDQLGASVDELRKIVDSLDGQVNYLDDQLSQVQANGSSALGKTLDGVSNKDMKAAALLIAFAQFRDSLGRQGPFKDDLVLLQKLVGNDDPELQAALQNLAPQAEKGGILTSQGLSQEFRGLAGDIVFSSLKGEDVSMVDQAKARMTQALNLKKDGELIGGTPTQKTVAKAQTQLDAGDVQGAIATLKTLDPEAQNKAQPFIDQAQATVLADQVQGMLRQMIVANVNGGNPMGTIKAVGQQIQNAVPGQAVVKDEASGLSILPAPKGFKGFSSGPTQ